MSEREGLEIKIEGLCKNYVHEGKVLEVLRDIDLVLHPGDLVSIRGRSGTGKSTFLHLLGTLDRPTRGTIRFGSRDVFELSPTKLAHFRNAHIGLMFQFHHLLNDFSALENVMMPALIRRHTRSAARERATKWLDLVGLSERCLHKPGELSGGEQQRVALARALMMEPTLLLADEPTGNLDPTTGEGIHEIFSDLNKRLGITIVIVTHDLQLASRLPRQLEMRDGGLVERSL